MFSLAFLVLILIIVFVVWSASANKRKTKLASRAQRFSNLDEKRGEEDMKAIMLEQMNDELEKTVQTDTIVHMVGIALNLLFAGINTGVGAAAHDINAGTAVKLIFFVLVAFLIVLNVSEGYALSMGKKRRVKIVERIEKFLVEEGLEKYKDDSSPTTYEIRGTLFSVITVALGVVALVVSLIAYFVGF